jgi:hypothetical protein
MKFRNTLFPFLCYMILSQGKLVSQTVQTFPYTGSVQMFTVPACVTSITVEARGAQGTAGTSVPGLGGIAKGVMSVSPGQVVSVYVGGQNGFNGGGLGSSPGGNGGGGSDVRFAPASLNDRQIVAGGGGGGGATNGNAPGGAGGGGTAVGSNFVGGAGGKGANNQAPPVGGTNGGNSGGAGGIGNGSNNGGAGGGGGLLSGGGGGTNTGYVTGGTGSLGIGGNGGGPTGPGAGGGGYYGGGGASGGTNSNAGGGGGSSWTGTLSAPSFTAGSVTGNGLVIFSYLDNGNSVVASASPTAICTGSNAVLTATGMTSYTWNTGAQTSSITVSPSVTTAFTVQATNSLNCLSSSVITITVNSGLPVLSITSSTNQTCLGKTVTLTAMGALTYTWSGGVTNGVAYTPSTTSSFTVTGENGCGTSSAVTTVTIAPLPVSALSSPTVICSGSPSTLTAVSAATGYTWQPISINQASTIVSPTVTTVYTVAVSDGTCSGVTDLTLTVLPIPTINIVASSSAVCIGEPVTMSATGGLSYTWSPGNLSGPSVTVFPSGPTLYSVTGNNSVGCNSGTTQIVVTSSGPLVNVAASSTLICAGDQVNLMASGNASGYNWTNGPPTPNNLVNPLINTVFTVTGASSSNSCTTTKTIEVFVFKPVVNISSSDSVICSGNTVTLTASGADSYLWDNFNNNAVHTVTPNATTVYTLTGTTSSLGLTCSVTETIQIISNPNPTITASGTPTSICKGQYITLTASGALSYSWSSGSVLATTTVQPMQVGMITYTVTGTNVNDCKSNTTVLIRVVNCPGISEQKYNDLKLDLYPNPSNSEFTIEADASVNLELVNELAQVIRVIELSAPNNYKVEITGLSKGIYFLKGMVEKTINKKIVITH